MAFLGKKILLIKLRALGDSVLLSATLSLLRQNFPDARIDIAVSAPWASLYEHDSRVGHVWPVKIPRNLFVRAFAGFVQGLRFRREKYDCVINLHAGVTSAWLSFFSGAPKRAVHFHGRHDRDRFSTVSIIDKGVIKPILERDFDTLRSLDNRLSIVAGTVPSLSVTPIESAWANEWLAAQALKPPVLGLGLGASRATKIWPIARFVEAARLWIEETGGSALAFLDAKETVLAQSFYDELSRFDGNSRFLSRIQLQDRQSLRRLMALISTNSVFLGNDSGPRHLAAALGIPTVTLFGPEDPYEWHPYPENRHCKFFIKGLECRTNQGPARPPWCSIPACTEFRHKCMTGIQSPEVVSKCMEFLK